MKLKTYIETHSRDGCRTQEEWAAVFGISRSYLAEILSGAKAPGRKAIIKIDHGTSGSVPASVWFDADPSDAVTDKQVAAE